MKDCSKVAFNDWVGFSSALKSMLWLDVIIYVDNNFEFIKSLYEEHESASLCYLPVDYSGLLCPSKIIFENFTTIFEDKKNTHQRLIQKS